MIRLNTDCFRVCVRVFMAVSFAMGCSTEPTQVRVQLEADMDVAFEASRLEVFVLGESGSAVEKSAEVGVDGEFPFEVPVAPANNDSSSRFDVQARITAADGRSLGFQRGSSAFVPGVTSYMTLRFEAECQGVSCPRGSTCVDGSCVDACVEAASAPGAARRSCSDPDPNERVGCTARGLVGEDFESNNRWPTCPDFEGAETQVCTFESGGAMLSVVDAASTDGPGSASICGASRVLRVETNGSSTSGAFISLPSNLEGPRWTRAMYYIPRSSLDAHIASGNNQALLAWASGFAPVLSDVAVNFRWSSGGGLMQWAQREPLVQDTDSYDIEFPTDRWFCFETGFDPAARSVTVGIDGELLSPSVSELANLFETPIYSRVGLFSGATAAVVFLDDIVVSDERVPCP